MADLLASLPVEERTRILDRYYSRKRAWYTVSEACEYLAISRSTLYLLPILHVMHCGERKHDEADLIAHKNAQPKRACTFKARVHKVKRSPAE